MKCPSCALEVINDGTTLLDPRKTRIGRHLPDGTQTTINDVRAGVRGHHPHHCPPGTTTTTPTHEQNPLF